MSQPFVGEVKMFGFNFAPRGWALCAGQILPIQQFTALFSLLGTMYGGNGQTTFALPNLQGRTPISQGQMPGGENYVQGQEAGQEVHTLLITEIPFHGHPITGNAAAPDAALPTANTWATGTANAYGTAVPDVTMNPNAIAAVGGNQPHENMPPFLVINFCIALQGIYPARN